MLRMYSVSACLCLVILHVAGEFCPGGEPIKEFNAERESDPSVYDDLTMEELAWVQKFMMRRQEFPIVELLVAARDSIINCTYIYHIERLPPSKAEALAYVDHNAPKPKRFALVIMYRGDAVPPVIEEYKVGPLPVIEGYERISGTADRKVIDYVKRNYFAPPDFTSFVSVALRELAKISHILEDVIGYKMTDCGDRCLRWIPGIPDQFDAGSRSRGLWLYMARVHEESYLHPIGLQFRVDTKDDLQSINWEVNFVWFRGETYKNFEEMAEKYSKPPGTGEPPVFENNKDLYSSLHHRGDPVPERNQRGPRSFMPDGRRYTVTGHHVEWQGWSFDFNMRSIIGMQVHDLRFKGERIAYELSLSELGIIYSGASPITVRSAYLDTPWFIGRQAFQLFPGLDCPDHGTFFDFAHFMYFSPMVFPNSVCLFEHTKSVPLRRHSEDQFGRVKYAQGMPGNVLILRSVVSVENYDYIMDYILYQNGAVEITTSLSGYILSSYYTGTPEDDRFGYEVHPSVLGQIHNHLIHFKVDLDILGTSNRFETLDTRVENIEDPANPTERLNAHMFSKNLRTTEKNATYKYNFDTPKYLLFHNNEKKNHVGNQRSYRLLPAGITKQLLPEGWAIENGFPWSRYQVAVTKQKDHEARASSIYNVGDLINPYVNFQDFIDDDENIVDEDLVAWVSLGTFHIPHSEDIPIVQTPALSLSFYLLPHNFFNEDASLASRDNIRLEPRDDGRVDVTYAGESVNVNCQPRLLRDVDMAAGGMTPDEDTEWSSSGHISHCSIMPLVMLFVMSLALTT